ncbi:MAG: hypothetical protein AAGC44_01140 [Planctomycetota bacterium]
MRNEVDAARSVVQSGALDAAHARVMAVAASAEEKKVSRVRDIQTLIGGLASTLRDRSDAAFDQAYASYFEGYEDQALDQFRELAELDGLPAASKAKGELEQEEDRVAWRLLRDIAVKQIGDAEYLIARETLGDMERLARRTGYGDQTAQLFARLSSLLIERVDVAAQWVESGQQDKAYATLIEVSRLSMLREASVNARRVLGKTRNLPEMRQAAARYDAMRELVRIQAAIAELGNASARDMAPNLRELGKLTTQYAGTPAAAQAEELLSTLNEQLAAR